MAPDPSLSRCSRYASLLPISRLPSLRILIVGCGAYGRACATLLAQTGFTNLTLMDDDRVSPENLGPQGYRPYQLGDFKVSALASDLCALNPDCGHDKTGLTEFVGRFPPTDPEDLAEFATLGPFTYIISASDSMACRRDLFNFFLSHESAALLIDNRMAAESFHLYLISRSPSSTVPYERTLFPDSEATPLPCSARATSFCPALSAALTLSAITRHLRSTPDTPDPLDPCFHGCLKTWDFHPCPIPSPTHGPSLPPPPTAPTTPSVEEAPSSPQPTPQSTLLVS